MLSKTKPPLNSAKNHETPRAVSVNRQISQSDVDTYVSSDEEDDVLDREKILNDLFKHYNQDKEKRKDLLGKTSQLLENVLWAGQITCLICIADVKRADSVWTCSNCFSFFHLNCIGIWSKDSLFQRQTEASLRQNDEGYYNFMGEFVPPKKSVELKWFCPLCRYRYSPEERPQNYSCYCGQVLNPQPQLWLLPHSCGNICKKQLKPDCGHQCQLQCHPGPCPPCCQYANVSCLCGKQPSKTVRCIDKNWKCERVCNDLLPCGKHLCKAICHKPGCCPPCKNLRPQSCECENAIKDCVCSANMEWHCTKVCGKALSCEKHTCKGVCHKGECGDCPLSLRRPCPCGKNEVQGSCLEVTARTCQDTCHKFLSCGIHTCLQRCHQGACNTCNTVVRKKCRCGLHEKDLPCSKVFTCDVKCKRMRDCDKHICNKKCCEGNCPPCDKICGKPLSCKKHKCLSVCHKGPCFLCLQKSQINCSCGKTSRNVACGQERLKRVVCLEPCRLPSKCHHSNNHRCHKYDCPPCTEKCGQTNNTTNCLHLCEAKCHDAVKVLLNSEDNTHPLKYGTKCLPHPKCVKSVLVNCVGGHGDKEQPCYDSKIRSCEQKCNRLLKCGNHKCSLQCHPVPNVDNFKEQSGCASCLEKCKIERLPGCTHPCTDGCHLAPCSRCTNKVNIKCHCNLITLTYMCYEYYANYANNEIKIQTQTVMRSCANRCSKNYIKCGHRCVDKCHPGDCCQDKCRKKVRIFCECKTLKMDITCDKHQTGFVTFPCDESCRQKIRIQQEAIESLKQQEEEKNRLEVENFENKFKKSRTKPKKETVERVKKSKINWINFGIYAGMALAIISAIIVALDVKG